ncbi:hypothetical protein TAMC210_09320 [Thermanaeromonas sp. C210]|nr:hypothetical protein TAMC210_09320 [Thermanaeromonas sp. C210]
MAHQQGERRAEGVVAIARPLFLAGFRVKRPGLLLECFSLAGRQRDAFKFGTGVGGTPARSPLTGPDLI